MALVGSLSFLIVALVACGRPADPTPVAGPAPEASALAPAAALRKQLDRDRQWPGFRGPLGTGVAPHADPPTAWGEGRNVRWKTALPGLGHSSPVVWGDRVFLTTAVEHGEAAEPAPAQPHGAHDNMDATHAYEFVVLAVDRSTGAIAWQKTVREERPHESAHVSASWASASAVTDGDVVVASFGSRGVFGLTAGGEPLWEADLGDMAIKHGHGEGSSPALHGDAVVIPWDHEGQDFVVALHRRTGAELWRVARDEVTSWSSPLVVEVGGQAQVVLSATGGVRAYDLATGAVVWHTPGLSGNVVATPVAAEGILYAGSSYERQIMLAVKLDGARGDLTGTDHILWTRTRDTPYVPSPVLQAGQLCFIRHLQGFLTCVDGPTGRTLWGPEKLPGLRRVYASPVGAAGRTYVLGVGGEALVLRNGPGLDIIARNQLDGGFSATPALVDRELFLRGEEHLYCVETEPSRSTPAASTRRAPEAAPDVPSRSPTSQDGSIRTR